MPYFSFLESCRKKSLRPHATSRSANDRYMCILVHDMGKLIQKIGIKNIVITSIVVVSAISGGLAIGLLLGKAFSTGKAATFDNPIDTDIEDDYEALLARYDENQDINEYRPYELANISWLHFAQEENTRTVSYGTVTAAIVKQKIFASDVKVGDRYFTESLSHSSIKKCGFRYYQQGEYVNYYEGKNIAENGTATWDSEGKVTLSLANFEEKWGKTLDRPIIYNISSKTVLSEALKENNDEYVVDLDLDPETAPARYVRQMVSMSNLESVPSFKSIHLTFTMDKNLNIKQFDVKEAYVVYVVGKNDSSAELTEYFYHNSDASIPELDTDINY